MSDSSNLKEYIESSDSCSICYEVLDNFIISPCNHKFHEVCIEQWFKNNISCQLVDKIH